MQDEASFPDSVSVPGQVVSRLAQDARRRDEVAQRAAQREQPSFLREVEVSEVGYTIPTRFMPFRHADLAAFIEMMRNRWGLVPDLSKVRLDPAALRDIPAENVDEAVFRQIVKAGTGSIDFASGRYNISPTEFVPILRVSINYESVLVGVAGIGQIAEAVAQDIYEAFCATAGASRAWSEVQQHVQVVGYGTTTSVNLGSNDAYEKLLSPSVRQFVASEMIDGKRFVADAGSYFSRDGLRAPANAILGVALDEIMLRLTRFDPDTGIATTSTLHMAVTARSDYHSGIVSVRSELPYEVHMQMIGELIAVLDATE